MVNPKLGEIILDPSCGTGGFLVSALEHIRNSGEIKTAKDEKKLQTSIKGVELKPLPHLLAITNMILHGVETPQQIKRDDMLSRPLREYGPKDRVDVIVANPPFGGVVKRRHGSQFSGFFPHQEYGRPFSLFCLCNCLSRTGERELFFRTVRFLAKE